MNTTALVEQLKNAGEDFEFYPTTKEMVRKIFDDCAARYEDFATVLDVGGGQCHFFAHVKEFSAEYEAREKIRHARASKLFEAEDEKARADAKREKGDSRWFDRYEELRRERRISSPGSEKNPPYISRYMVIEKSKILIDALPPDVFVVGTDFWQTTLLDKNADTVFCNPPYSEFAGWMKRIILETNAKRLYFIVPERWKNDETIKKALMEANCKVERIGVDTFLEGAERRARANVEILRVDRKKEYPQDDAFDRWFKTTFCMEEQTITGEACYDEFFHEKEKIKDALVRGRNKVEILCSGYENAIKNLFEHFRAIASLDTLTLSQIGIRKDAVSAALKQKIGGLKVVYWEAAFRELREITSRLTHHTREKLFNRFREIQTVDFTPENVYALLVWVIKNANQYFDEQLVHMFTRLSSPENVQKYKSNERVFTESGWRCFKGYDSYLGDNKPPSHFTLDYRIVCTDWCFVSSFSWQRDKLDGQKVHGKIEDFCTIARNLGLAASFEIQQPETFGKSARVLFRATGKHVSETLLEYKCYKNNNVHIRMNVEFTKSLNVAAAKLLGWIKTKADISREFTPEMAAGAEKYWDNTFKLTTENVPLLCAGETTF